MQTTQIKIRSEVMNAAELIKKLTIAAVEVYILGGDGEQADAEAGLFKDSIPLIAQAWGLENGEAGEALAAIERQYEAVRDADPDEEIETAVDEKLLLKDPDGPEIISLLWALIDTGERLDRRKDREKIVDLTHYMKDFWDLEELITG